MSVGTVLVLVVVALLAMLLSRVPVAFAMLAAGLLGLVLLEDAQVASSTIGSVPLQSISKWSLVVIPMFILMGLLAMEAGLAEALFRLANRWLGSIPGALGLATIATCAAFAAVTGSSVATVATVGRFAVTEMRSYGYSKTLAGGIVGSAATLGILIPPSIALVLYGVIAGESVGSLLIAGVIPGLMSALLYGGSVIIRVYRSSGVTDTRAPNTRMQGKERVGPKDYVALLYIALLFSIVIGGIYLGVFTPTEAGAVGASVALVALVATKVRQKSSGIADAWKALTESATVTSMVLTIVVGTSVFSYFLVSAGVPQSLADLVVRSDLPAAAIVLLLLLAVIPLGMFLDGVSILLITVPLAYPIVTELGYDGIWFGILLVKMIELSLITPPVGINAFVLSGAVDELSVDDAFRGVLSFLPMDVLTISILFIFPSLTLWLPTIMG